MGYRQQRFESFDQQRIDFGRTAPIVRVGPDSEELSFKLGPVTLLGGCLLSRR